MIKLKGMYRLLRMLISVWMNPFAATGSFMVLLVLIAAVFAPYVAPYGQYEMRANWRCHQILIIFLVQIDSVETY